MCAKVICCHDLTKAECFGIQHAFLSQGWNVNTHYFFFEKEYWKIKQALYCVLPEFLLNFRYVSSYLLTSNTYIWKELKVRLPNKTVPIFISLMVVPSSSLATRLNLVLGFCVVSEAVICWFCLFRDCSEWSFHDVGQGDSNDPYQYFSCFSQSLKGSVQKVARKVKNVWVWEAFLECSLFSREGSSSPGDATPRKELVRWECAVWVSAGAGLEANNC